MPAPPLFGAGGDGRVTAERFVRIADTGDGVVDNGRRNDRTDLRVPAFLLVCACCRWPRSAAADGAVRVAAANVADWDAFLRLVQRHRVAGMVAHALAPQSTNIPAAVLSALAAQAQKTTQDSLRLAAETVRLQRLFDDNGVPNLALKGAALAQLAYGSPALKHGRDADMLVAPNDAFKAFRLLAREGYAVLGITEQLDEKRGALLIRYVDDLELVDRRRRLYVDLQWRPAFNPYLLKGVDAHSPAQVVAFADGAAIRTLNDDDLFAYLSVHGAKHSWARLKWLADLNALLAHKDAEALAHLYRHAQAKGAGRCAGQALLLCQRFLGLSLPADIEAALGNDRRVAALVAIAEGAIAEPKVPWEADSGVAGLTRDVARMFLLGRGWRYVMAQCGTLLVAREDIMRLALPQPLEFMYVVLRLPLWLWRRGARALRPHPASRRARDRQVPRSSA